MLQWTCGKQFNDLLPLLKIGFGKQTLFSAISPLVTHRSLLLSCFPLGPHETWQNTTGVTLGPTGYVILRRKCD